MKNFLLVIMAALIYGHAAWAGCYSSITLPQKESDVTTDRCWFVHTFKNDSGELKSEKYLYEREITYCATCTAIGPTLGLAAFAVPFEYFPAKSAQQKNVHGECESAFNQYLSVACPDAYIIDTENKTRLKIDEYYQQTK